jgi:hypothetical protein
MSAVLAFTNYLIQQSNCYSTSCRAPPPVQCVYRTRGSLGVYCDAYWRLLRHLRPYSQLTGRA